MTLPNMAKSPPFHVVALEREDEQAKT